MSLIIYFPFTITRLKLLYDIFNALLLNLIRLFFRNEMFFELYFIYVYTRTVHRVFGETVILKFNLEYRFEYFANSMRRTI